MLTDTKLRNLKPKEKLYKVNDRDGLYVAVTPAGSVSFRYNYAINGRQETVTFGRYGIGGITLAEARDRSLTPGEIGLMYRYLEKVGTTPSIRVAVKLLLLTMVRKSELTNATWSEINFSEAIWTIPKERMKRRNPHLVFLSRQVMDILVALKTFAGGSDFILPSRYDSDAPMSSATMNRVLDLTYKAAQKDGHDLTKFGPHDLRRTASTLLHCPLPLK